MHLMAAVVVVAAAAAAVVVAAAAAALPSLSHRFLGFPDEHRWTTFFANDFNLCIHSEAKRAQSQTDVALRRL